MRYRINRRTGTLQAQLSTILSLIRKNLDE